MGLFGGFVYKDKNKVQWYLHSKQAKKTKFYYFSKDAVGALPAVPGGYEMITNSRTGLPMLKKKIKKEAAK
jgi:hypothetical protein